MPRIFWLLISLFAFSAYELQAQQGVWRNIGIEEELPDPNITAIVKTPDGELYIGSSTGIFRYDGYQFIMIKMPSELQINPYVTSLICDGKSVYAGVRNGIVKIDIASQEVNHLISKNINSLYNLYFNHDTSRLIASNFDGISIIPINQADFKVTDSIQLNGKLNLMVRPDDAIIFWNKRQCIKAENHTLTLLHSDPDVIEAKWWEKEKCWLLIKQDGIYTYDAETDRSSRLQIAFQSTISEFQYIYSDGGSSMWIKTPNGVGQLSSVNDTTLKVYSKENGNITTINSNNPQAFYTDNQGTTWVGGDGSGLGYLTAKAAKISYISNASAEVAHFWHFYNWPENGQLMCGSSDGLVSGDASGNGFYKLKRYNPKAPDHFSVTAIADLNKNNWIVSVYNEGLYSVNKKTFGFNKLQSLNDKLPTNYIYGLKELSNNKLAVLTHSNAYILDKKTYELSSFKQNNYHRYSIYSAFEDSKGNYIFSGSSGIQIFDKHGIEYPFSDLSKGFDKGLKSNIVMCVHETTDSKYLVATMGSGLFTYDMARDTFQKVELITDPVNVFGIVAVNDSLWVLSTSNGLCGFNSADKRSVMLNKTNLLPFNDFNQSAFARFGQKLYFGGESGMLAFSVNDATSLFKNMDEIVVWKDAKTIQEITLGPGENKLKLRLGLKSLHRFKKMQFATRIAGLQEEWNYLENGYNNLEYNYLPPGEYQLEIKTYDPAGFLNTPLKTIKLTIQPHYYQTNWFKAILIFLFGGLLYFILRYFSFLRLKWKLHRLEADRKIMLERSRISQELHDNLGSQLTYLISGLEMTELLLNRKELEKTNQSIVKMQTAATESMQQLRESIWALSPGKMTLLSLAVQFEKWCRRICENNENLSSEFDFSLMTDETIDPTTGLNMFRIMQESVHNVLKHADAKKLICTIVCTNSDVIITIQDDGKGFDQDESSGHGLLSMNKRAEKIHARLEIQSVVGSGTEIVFTIAKNKLKDE